MVEPVVVPVVEPVVEPMMVLVIMGLVVGLAIVKVPKMSLFYQNLNPAHTNLKLAG